MSLSDLIAAEIATSGPMPLDRYMDLCLGHGEYGYYATRDPLGASGDFITAPEISQIYGEMIAIWLITAWQAAGAPGMFALVELGPGRGTLMADILRVARGLPNFLEAARPVLVETSPTLRRAQAERLSGADSEWVADIDALPDGPLFLIANEFFDALPVRQFQRVDTIWMERKVTHRDGAFAWALAPTTLPAPPPATAADGAIWEYGAEGVEIATKIGQRLAVAGGAALIADYGDRDGIGDTFQALRAHKPTDPLADPGTADLTTHVRFGDLITAAGGQSQFTAQGPFLERMGITERANALLSRGDQDVIAAHRRLTHPDEMGSLFKMLALLPDTAAPSPGFE